MKMFFIIPTKDKSDTRNIPKTYVIEKGTRIDEQVKYECAAYSSAYVLRSLGYNVDGATEYKRYPRKLLSGNVLPKGIIVYFRRKSIKVSYKRGTVETLKKHVSLGVPVILFIRVFKEKMYQHFVPVVGYDEESVYTAESLSFLRNCDEPKYTRIINNNELEQLWKTWIPFSKNSYIVIEKQ